MGGGGGFLIMKGPILPPCGFKWYVSSYQDTAEDTFLGICVVSLYNDSKPVQMIGFV